ncbi:MAG: glycosyltransferase, partial [Planctomycetota bacterium]
MSRAVGNVAVVVPLFNEEASVAELIARLDASLTKHPGSRIVIVDDGSSDRTVETLARAAASGVGPA